MRNQARLRVLLVTFLMSILSITQAISEPLTLDLAQGKRTVVFEVGEASIMEQVAYRARVKDDSDENERLKELVEAVGAKQEKPWRYSDDIETYFDVSGDTLAFSYQNKSGKREDSVNTHIYVLHPSGSKIFCKNQEAIRKRNGQVSTLSLVPSEDTNLYKTSDKIATFLEDISKTDVPDSLPDAGKTLLTTLKNDQEKNAYERLVDRIPGKWGFAMAVALRGTGYVMERAEKNHRYNLLSIKDGNYALTKLSLYEPKEIKKIFSAKEVGRNITLTFKQTFGKPVYLIIAQLNFTEDQKARQSSLKDLVIKCTLNEQQRIEGDEDGILDFLQGQWKWVGGSEMKEEERPSFEIVGTKLTIRAKEWRSPRIRSGWAPNEWFPVVRQYTIVPPIRSVGNNYTLNIHDVDRDRDHLLIVSKEGYNIKFR